MARPGAVTWKGKPMTLAGQPVTVGQQAPDFTLHVYENSEFVPIRPQDLRGKPTLISVVPSLDTGVCQKQTRRMNQELAALGGKINALTVSLDLPFAMNRFCGAENIKSLRAASDYQERSFGLNWGMLIEERKVLARGLFVLDASGKVVYSQLVPEISQEPDYEPALAALKSLAG